MCMQSLPCRTAHFAGFGQHDRGWTEREASSARAGPRRSTSRRWSARSRRGVREPEAPLTERLESPLVYGKDGVSVPGRPPFDEQGCGPQAIVQERSLAVFEAGSGRHQDVVYVVSAQDGDHLLVGGTAEEDPHVHDALWQLDPSARALLQLGQDAQDRAPPQGHHVRVGRVRRDARVLEVGGEDDARPVQDLPEPGVDGCYARPPCRTAFLARAVEVPGAFYG